MNIKNFKKFLLISTLIIGVSGFTVKADTPIKTKTDAPIILMINHKVIESAVPPVIIDSRTLVPARAVFEELGANVLWVNETKQIFVSFKNDLVLLTINNDIANINGENIKMDVPPQIINDSTMIPLRFVAEALNFEIGWNGDKKIASINSPVEPTTEAPTEKPTEQTTEAPTQKPTEPTTEVPTQKPTEPTTEAPTQKPTEPTTEAPTQKPTEQQTKPPSADGIVILEGNKTQNTETTIYPPIQNANYDLVNLTGIDMPINGDKTFKIYASGKISSIMHDIIQDPTRLYIDIENSISNLSENITVTGSNAVQSIRTAQQAGSKNVTRIVFDLSNAQSYDVYMSEDRQTLNIKFKPVVVDKITFQNVGGEDFINIYGNSSFKTSIMELSNPNRIVIDILNTFSNIGNMEAKVAGNFISAVRTSQFDSSTVRIVLDTTKLLNYEIIDNNSYTTIKLLTPTYKNIDYENSNDAPKLILKKDKDSKIDINAINHQDKYLDGYYKISLKGDYTNSYGYGNYKINDGYLNSIKIQIDNGNTEFIFDEKNVYAYKVTEDEQNIYIHILNPKTAYKKVVVIDPGHGGTAPGTIQNGLTEKNITLDVGNRLYLLLEQDPDIKVYTTRTTDTNPSFDYRTGLANHSADMFVSVHCNSINNSSVSGVQVFYPNPNDTRGALSKQLGDLLMEGVTSQTGFPNRPANQSMGYAFKVLKDTKVPACLVEMGFLTNTSDATKLATPEGRQQVAQGVYQGIKKAFETVIKER